MSLGVNVLLSVVEEVARRLGPDWDIEIMEMHHRGKVDAPSGTALALGRAAAAGRGVEFEQVEQRARDGITGPRRTGDIGFAALRGGDAVGDHHVIFAGAAERLELDPPGDQPGDLRERRHTRRPLGGRAATGGLRPEGGPRPLKPPRVTAARGSENCASGRAHRARSRRARAVRREAQSRRSRGCGHARRRAGGSRYPAAPLE